MAGLEDRLIGGRYKIDHHIAEGGMGAVYAAHHNLSKKKVALKILFAHIGKDEAARQRFLREVSAPAQIGHDGIVEVYDAGFDQQDGSLFVAMEFLDGEPLRDRLAKGGHSVAQLVAWFEEFLDPLAAAHETGIVHRDLKPENIFVATRRDGSEAIKILDFGIARDLDSSETNVTHTGIAMGTPHYMAPEQAMSAKGVTAAADVWAVGVMLYEALLGRPPFDGETASAIVVHACTQAHASLSQVAPHVPQPLAAFVDRCLEKEPAGRPQDGRQMLQELRQVSAQMGGGESAQMPGNSVRTGPMAGSAFAPTGAPGPGYQTPTPHGTPPSYQTPAPHGTPNPGYQTPAPHGTGTALLPSNMGGAPPSGFGTHPSAVGQSYVAAPKKKGGGMAIGLVLAVLVGGVFLVGGGIAAAILIFSGDEGGDTETGTVIIQSNIPTGELLVDGASRGPVVPGQQFQVESGSHQFEIHEAGTAVASGTLAVAAGEDQTLMLNRTFVAPPPPPPRPPPVAVPSPVPIPGRVQNVNGQLRPGDSQMPSGKYFDTYRFEWTAGTRIRLHMDAAQVDTYLHLRAPSGSEVTNDDRPGGGLNAGIDATLTESGSYEVICTTYAPNQTGDYTLTVWGP